MLEQQRIFEEPFKQQILNSIVFSELMKPTGDLEKYSIRYYIFKQAPDMKKISSKTLKELQ